MSQSIKSVRQMLMEKLADAADLAEKLRLTREEFLHQAGFCHAAASSFSDEEEITKVG